MPDLRRLSDQWDDEDDTTGVDELHAEIEKLKHTCHNLTAVIARVKHRQRITTLRQTRALQVLDVLHALVDKTKLDLLGSSETTDAEPWTDHTGMGSGKGVHLATSPPPHSRFSLGAQGTPTSTRHGRSQRHENARS